MGSSLTGGIKKGVIFLSRTSWTWNFAIADNVWSSRTDVIRRPGSTASNWKKKDFLNLMANAFYEQNDNN